MATTSVFSVTVEDARWGDATREGGRRMRDEVLSLLRQAETVEISLADRALTPSFADELFGGLIREIGPEAFRSRLVVSGLQDASRSLVRHVLSRRAAEANRV